MVILVGFMFGLEFWVQNIYLIFLNFGMWFRLFHNFHFSTFACHVYNFLIFIQMLNFHVSKQVSTTNTKTNHVLQNNTLSSPIYTRKVLLIYATWWLCPVKFNNFIVLYNYHVMIEPPLPKLRPSMTYTIFLL